MSVYESTSAPLASSHFGRDSSPTRDSNTLVKPEEPQIASTASNVVISERTGKPKRRKAVRACIHCQRTHLTCDNNRPCERCVHRGFAESCVDGVRKKAKYLGADEGSAKTETKPAVSKARPRSKYKIDTPPSVPSLSPEIHGHKPLSTLDPSQVPVQVPVSAPLDLAAVGVSPAVPVRVPYYDQFANTGSHGLPGQHRFQSQTTDLEYSILGTILQGDQSESSPSFSDDSASVHVSQPTSLPSYQARINNYNLDQQSLTDVLFQHEQQNLANFDEWIDYPRPPPISLTINEQTPGASNGLDIGQNPLDEHFLHVHEHPHQSITDATNGGGQGLHRTKSSTTVMTMSRGQKRSPAEIYRTVRRPFPYTPGFHTLIRYLKSRFSRTDLMDIVRYMASYRPSFIAITNSLTEDDLVFMEKYFQRTLLEYEKYFVYSGTPTIVWRRTGQIAAVGHEFCVLSGWPMETLLNADHGTGKFIMEVMDNQSVVEYFKVFSEISFNDSSGSTMSTCTLVTPQGQCVKTSCVFTLRKDLFGIPMMIIGNFLPILV